MRQGRPPAWLADKVWRLVRGPAGLPETQLILLPSGRIGGAWGTDFVRWQVTNEQLHLFDTLGRARIAFPLAMQPALALDGQTMPCGEPCRILYLRDVPVWPATAIAPEAPPSGRRNLVVLRAGPDSLHPFWLQSCPEGARSWDLCLCTYGAGTAETAAEHRAHYPGSKFEGLARLLAEESFWGGYDYVWFPDDDLLADWQTINLMFELCRAYGLALAQPSLAPGSFVNHPITRRADANAVLRFTSFVEIMAPIFSQAALRRAAATFALNPSGYGLDHLWQAIIDVAPTAIAVLDAVSVLHTRPIGASYDRRSAAREGWAIEDSFHQVNRYEVRGLVMSQPVGHANRHGVVLTPPATAAA
jgi:hypothetical protein